MLKLITYAVLSLPVILVGCGRNLQESITEVRNGDFKTLTRTQEFYNSGIQNVDICVAPAPIGTFPNNKAQCILQGYDFSGLSIKWQSQNEILISFSCGRVTSFSNYAVVSKGVSIPVEFHILLRDKCEQQSKGR